MIANKKNHSDKSIRLARLFPNMVTIIGLCVGLSAMRFAFKGQFEPAVAFVFLSSCIDGLDGKLARILDATSEFGAQLDSLSDFLNFGVAPPFVLYLWVTKDVRGLGWALVLFFAVCCAIRLARFNCKSGKENSLDEQPPEWSKRFFVGIPAPAGAMMTLGPLVTMFAFKDDFPHFYSYITFVENPFFVSIYAATIACLMASRMPTFSFRRTSVSKKYISVILVAVGLFAVCVIIEPWLTAWFVGIWYYSTLPMSVRSYLRFERKNDV